MKFLPYVLGYVALVAAVVVVAWVIMHHDNKKGDDPR